jgi:hypothetical protein
MGMKLGLSHYRNSLKVYENRLLGRISRPEREEWQEGGQDCITRNFITCKLHQILLG